MGAGASATENVSDIGSEIDILVNDTSGASAKANCEVNIGYATILDSVGCSIKIKNSCDAKSSSKLKSQTDIVDNISTAVQNATKNFPPSYFTISANWVNDSTKLKQHINDSIVKSCNSFANSDTTVKIPRLEIRKCRSVGGKPLYFTIENTGYAQANCILHGVANLRNDIQNIVANKAESGADYLGLLIKYRWVVCAAILCLSCHSLILKYITESTYRSYAIASAQF